jgi:hypothetical protein
MMSDGKTCLCALLLLLPMLGASAQDLLILESKRLHLGKPGQWEWDSFKDHTVDAERIERKFQGRANPTEHTLCVWQRDVKLGWPVKLNGVKLGALVNSETAMEHMLVIPPNTLRDGENVLTIDAPANLDDVEVGPIYLFSNSMRELLSRAKIEVVVTEDAAGKELPCRITLTRADGTLQPLLAEPAGNVAARVGVVYTRNGKATLSVPAGEYRLYAGRGFEWSVAEAAISLSAGDSKPVALKLKREVPTEGWVAADSHIHTLTHSGHGDATIQERMLTIAGEGIELAIATDHNHHADYAPSAASAGVADRFTPVIGNEVTTKHGHFNAFPIQLGSKVVNHQQEDWFKLLPEIRATPGVKVITLNHPRDLHSGFIPLGGMQFNPKTGKHRQADALDIDALEVVTSAAMQSDIHLLYRDWFALLNRGHRMAAIGSSDSHDVNRFILGQGRTYVSVKDADPANLDLNQVWRSYQEGRLLVSLGLLAQIKVDDRFVVGDTATGVSDSIKVEATVLGPSWVRADHVALYANGVMIREQNVEDAGRAGEKARIIWQIPRPAHDVHLVVIATGPGVTAPYWEIPRPYQASSKTFVPRVIGSTNPVWLDADGNDKFESAFAIAQRLVQQHGADRAKLDDALKSHDEAVAVQVDAILQEGG